MLCERCGENEAVVNIVEIVGGEERTHRLCRECARETAGGHIAIMQLPAGDFLNKLLTSVLGQNDDATQDSDGSVSGDELRKSNILCPSCGMSHGEFMKYGNFGCPGCYRTFNFLLDAYFRKIQGGSSHSGKSPRYSPETLEIPDIQLQTSEEDSGDDMINITVDRDSSMEELRSALSRAVAREEYEEAARIRDVIKASREERDA